MKETASGPQPPPASEATRVSVEPEPWDVDARGRPLLIFDGDCGFCTRSAEWVRDHQRSPLSIAPWQFIEYRGPGLATIGLEAADFDRYAWWIDAAGHKRRGHHAIGAALRSCGTGWRLIGALISLPVVSWLAALGYRLVSLNRHRLPGGTPACRL